MWPSPQSSHKARSQHKEQHELPTDGDSCFAAHRNQHPTLPRRRLANSLGHLLNHGFCLHHVYWKYLVEALSKPPPADGAAKTYCGYQQVPLIEQHASLRLPQLPLPKFRGDTRGKLPETACYLQDRETWILES